MFNPFESEICKMMDELSERVESLKRKEVERKCATLGLEEALSQIAIAFGEVRGAFVEMGNAVVEGLSEAFTGLVEHVYPVVIEARRIQLYVSLPQPDWLEKFPRVEGWYLSLLYWIVWHIPERFLPDLELRA